MKVLFVATEAVPFMKTGGLADVTGSLPGELGKHGIDARVIIPDYGQVPPELAKEIVFMKTVTVNLGWRYQYFQLSRIKHKGVIFYLIGNDYYFKRENIYGYDDDAERFAFFSKAVLQSLPHLGFVPQVLHCHDWHTGPLCVFLREQYSGKPFYDELRTVFTIHNISYQGLFPQEILHEVMELEDDYFSPHKLEFYGKVSYLKGGLNFSDYITTVSPTYAREIQEPHYGRGLEGVLRQRCENLCGIINGIDQEYYNPEKDQDIFVQYNGAPDVKQQNKIRLQELLGLPQDPSVPLVAFVNRLVENKGLDLIIHVLEEMMLLGLQLVFLGTGDKRYEKTLTELAHCFPQQISVNTCFDDILARRIYAGSDFFLLPALYEPCGMSQLIAMRYGSIPVVRETGGLKDTVIPYDETTGLGNGFTFADYNAHEMLFTLMKGLDCYEDESKWEILVENALKGNHCWDNPAREYAALYRRLVKKRAGEGMLDVSAAGIDHRGLGK